MKSILADAKASGTVTLDFGASNKTAQTAVTGIGSAKAATIILASMRIETCW